MRARHPRFTAEMMAANQPVVAGLRRVAGRHGDAVTPAQAALAWVLAQGPPRGPGAGGQAGALGGGERGRRPDCG